MMRQKTSPNEMKMPSNYTDMSAAEMEYDGGFNWGKFGEVALYVGVGVAAVGLLGAGVAGAVAADETASMLTNHYARMAVSAGTGVFITGLVTASVGTSSLLVDHSRQQ